ncbi:MAG: hypothetical protein LBT00_07440 [Spirochaetaceae bacterium]|jgi:hypothetical protein|nr:hypothetical protein [Spirochaetaceae bacterium]
MRINICTDTVQEERSEVRGHYKQTARHCEQNEAVAGVAVADYVCFWSFAAGFTRLLRNSMTERHHLVWIASPTASCRRLAMTPIPRKPARLLSLIERAPAWNKPIIEKMDEKKRPESLTGNIDKIIGVIKNGGEQQRKEFQRRFFNVAETPQFLKQMGIRGDYFSIRYGVISRHLGKDTAHDLTGEQWKQLSKEIARPFAISRYGKGFRFFTSVKVNENWIVAGVDVKKPSRNREVVSVHKVGYFAVRHCICIRKCVF